MNVNGKMALAFFLVLVAAVMVLVWMFRPPQGETNSIALLAGFVTLFIKMAADSIGYQFGSSSGSEKKDDNSARVTAALADKVPSAPTVVVTWWSLLENSERSAISASTEQRVQDIAALMRVGRAKPEDLDYLVNATLLSQSRAAVLKTA